MSKLKTPTYTKSLYTFQDHKYNHDHILNILELAGDERQVGLWRGDEWKKHDNIKYKRGPCMK